MNYQNNCYACLMPLKNDTNRIKDSKYCSHCSDEKGNFNFEGNLKEFKEICYKQMRKNNMSILKAKWFTFLIGFAPQWKR